MIRNRNEGLKMLSNQPIELATKTVKFALGRWSIQVPNFTITWRFITHGALKIVNVGKL